MKKYPHLFSSKTIRGVTYRNRILATPTGLTYPEEYSGAPDFRTVLFYEKKARGGAAIVTLGETPVNDVDAARRPNVEKIRPDFKRMIFPGKDWVKFTDAIKRHGAIPSVQLAHAGLWAVPFFNDGQTQPMGPVDMIRPDGAPVRAMNEEDMARIASDFAEAAFCAKLAGFPHIMIQCCHGWLLAQYLSPVWNTRTDEYGGCIENRAKFPLKVLKAVREKVGNDTVIEIRITGDEHQEGGWTPEECAAFCKMVEGTVDLVHISSGDYHNSEYYGLPTQYMPHFTTADFAKKMRMLGVTIPLAIVGSNDDPAIMEELLADGTVDFIAIGRCMLADGDLANKYMAGKEEDIRPCIRCGECMAGLYGGYYSCNVNPTAGQEAYLLNTPAPSSSKDVVIIGGGPGGMQAAITAYDRGHKVAIVDKAATLGGTICYSDHDVHKGDLKKFKDFLIHQVEKRDIKVMLNTEANNALLDELKPQALIVAVGAVPNKLPIPGFDKAFHAAEAYYAPEKVGKKVVIIGGGLIGCELALQLAEDGKETTILEITDTLARDDNKFHRLPIMELMEKNKDLVHGIVSASVTAIEDNGVKYTNANGENVFVEADTVLYAVGSHADNSLVEELRAWDGWEFFRPIGDCVNAGVVKGAVHDGYFAALDIL